MEGFCRGCLIKYNEPMELLQYTEKNRRLFVYSTGLQVKRNDTFTFQLCKDCFLNMKIACKFKKLCRTSDKRFKNYLALKDVGDPVDFCTFLKNSDETLTFRLPMASGNNTPANQRCRDDDNESTCTSIRNFMTDILQGEEMPDTEAQIIKEVIEEEADVLDDSLDSHWLQDDMSIDTDFRLDFSFSPFSTPRSTNNDHCYTPKRYADPKEEPLNFYSINNEKHTTIMNDFTNAIKREQNDEELCDLVADQKSNIKILNNVKEISNYSINDIADIDKSAVNTHRKQENLKELCDFSLDGIDSIEKSENNALRKDESLIELCDLSISVKSDNSNFKHDQNVKELCDFGIDEIDAIDRKVSTMELPSLDVIDKDEPNQQNYYVLKNYSDAIQCINDTSNASTNIEALLKDKPCTIDRNLEEALKNTDNQEFSLNDLLVSPPVFQGASTPNITNILFGDKLDTSDNDSKSKIEFGTLDDVQGDIEIFEEFFQNDTKEFTLEDIKKVNRDINIEDCKEIALEGIEVDNKENQSEYNDKGLSISENFQSNDNKEAITNADKVIHDDMKFDLEYSYCNMCKKKYKSYRALSMHLLKTHNIKIIKPKPKPKVIHKKKLCNSCGREFKGSASFHRHSKICGKPKKETFKCQECDQEFKHQIQLDKHMVWHNGVVIRKKDTGKEYVCTICGAILNKVGNYSVHMRRHTKNYVKSCEECGKGFHSMWEFRSHMTKHTGETPYNCQYCLKSFSRKDALGRHIALHTGLKLHQCDHCGFKCKRKDELRRHLTKTACRNISVKDDEKMDIDSLKEQVTVIYATGDDNQIKKQLPFLETEVSI